MDLPPNVTTKTFTIELTDDALAENAAGDGGVEVEVLNVGDYLVSSQNKFRVTVIDEDPYFLLDATSQNLEVAEGQTLSVTATLKRGDLTKMHAIRWQTSDDVTNPATPGEDYTAVDGGPNPDVVGDTIPYRTTTFAAGETVKTLEVITLTDMVDDTGERFGLVLVGQDTDGNLDGARFLLTGGTMFGPGSATPYSVLLTVTITNDGPLPKAWVAEYGHASGTVAVDAIAERLENPGAGPWVKVLSESFGTGHTSGELHARLAGVDAEMGNWRAGIALAGNEATGTHKGYDLTGRVTGLYPYVHWQALPKVALWTALGYAAGEISVAHATKFSQTRADMSSRLVAVGLQTHLLRSPDNPLHVRFDSDAMWVRSQSEDNPHMRGTHTRSQRYRSTVWGDYTLDYERFELIPKVSASIESNAGDIDARTHATFGLGATVNLDDVSVGLDVARSTQSETTVSARVGIGGNELVAAAQATWSDEHSHHTQLQGRIDYDMKADGRGLQLSLRPEHGSASPGQMHSRVGYGLHRHGYLLSPYLEHEVLRGTRSAVGMTVKPSASSMMDLSAASDGLAVQAHLKW